MPFYTFQCPKCKREKEELREIGNFDEPVCSECSNILPRRYVYMKKIFKPNAKPASKDGSWGFGKNKKQNKENK